MPSPRNAASRAPAGLLAWVLLIPAGLVLAGLLVGILLTLLSVRTQLTQQNQRTRLLIQKADPSLRRVPGALDTAAPLLRDAAPVLKASRAAIPQARRTARQTQRLLTTSQPVVDDLASAVAVLPPLLDQLQPVARDLGPVAAQLRAAELPSLLGEVRRLADAGTRALPELGDLADEVRRRALLRRASRALPLIGTISALQKSAVETNRAQLDVNRSTFGATKHIEDLFVQSLAIQRETLAHTASIDRKLGGATVP